MWANFDTCRNVWPILTDGYKGNMHIKSIFTLITKLYECQAKSYKKMSSRNANMEFGYEFGYMIHDLIWMETVLETADESDMSAQGVFTTGAGLSY